MFVYTLPVHLMCAVKQESESWLWLKLAVQVLCGRIPKPGCETNQTHVNTQLIQREAIRRLRYRRWQVPRHQALFVGEAV